MLSRIVIQSEFGAISIRSQNAKVHCRPARYELNLKGKADAKVNLKSNLPKIGIDQSASFASIGMTGPLEQGLSSGASAMQRGIDQIGRIAREGMHFLRIEQGGNPISEIASTKRREMPKITLRAVERPEISFVPGSVTNKPDVMTLESNWEYIESQSEYVPGEVVVSWGTRPSIEITVEPGVELQFPIPLGVGLNLDEAI
jgi:hypothetical protein